MTICPEEEFFWRKVEEIDLAAGNFYLSVADCLHAIVMLTSNRYREFRHDDPERFSATMAISYHHFGAGVC